MKLVKPITFSVAMFITLSSFLSVVMLPALVSAVTGSHHHSGSASGVKLYGGNECKYHGYDYCYTATLHASGAVNLSGSSTSASFATKAKCQTWMSKFASGNGGEVQLPNITLGSNKGFSADLEGWKGPGTYPLQTPSSSSYVSLGGNGGIIEDSTQYTAPIQNPTQPQSTTALVKSNGSVTITFKNLANPADPSQVVSGVAQFNCQN